jgi:hypothetical protein
MTLRRQSIHHPAHNVSFTDDSLAVEAALPDAAFACEKERSHAY